LRNRLHSRVSVSCHIPFGCFPYNALRLHCMYARNPEVDLLPYRWISCNCQRGLTWTMSLASFRSGANHLQSYLKTISISPSRHIRACGQDYDTTRTYTIAPSPNQKSDGKFVLEPSVLLILKRMCGTEEAVISSPTYPVVVHQIVPGMLWGKHTQKQHPELLPSFSTRAEFLEASWPYEVPWSWAQSLHKICACSNIADLCSLKASGNDDMQQDAVME
jgi:hypothetical protein